MNRKRYLLVGILIIVSLIAASCRGRSLSPDSAEAATQQARATFAAILNQPAATVAAQATSDALADDTTLFLPPLPASTPAPLTIDDSAYLPQISMGLTRNHDFAAMAVNERSESLVAMTETDNIGNILAVTGGVWNSPDGKSIVFFTGADGLPDRAVFDEYVFLFSDWQADTVDVTLVDSDGTTQSIADVPVDTGFISSARFDGQPVGGGKLAAPAYQTSCETVTRIIQYVDITVSAVHCVAEFLFGAGAGGIALCGATGIASHLTADVVTYYVCDTADPAFMTDDGSAPLEAEVIQDARASVGLAENTLESRGVESEPVPYGGVITWPDRFDKDRRQREGRNAGALAALAALLAAASGLLFAAINVRNRAPRRALTSRGVPKLLRATRTYVIRLINSNLG